MSATDIRRYERLKMMMEDWANWMGGYRMKLGWPSRSIGIESGYVSREFDEMLGDVEAEMYRLIDAAVNDLSAGHHAAINRCYGVSAVFRFPRGNYDTLLIEAHDLLIIALPIKGVAI